MVARITVDTALDRLFDYAVPAELAPLAVPGARVKVPFGHRTATGYIIEVVEEGEGPPSALPLPTSDFRHPASGLKPILSVEGERTFLLPGVLRLARWIAAYYCAPVELCVRGVLPAPVREGRSRDKARLFVEAREARSDVGGQRSAEGGRAVSDGPKPADGGRPPLAPLTPRQRELLDNIRRVGGGWLQSVCSEFACSPETLRRLAEAGHLAIASRVVRRDPLANRRILPTSPLPLNPDQAAALAGVLAACAACARIPASDGAGGADRSDDPGPRTRNLPPSPKPILLYGVTGSGKTEVYLQAIAHVLAQGRGAIVLVPEIALTPQTVQRFASRFGDRVAVLHSALSDGERHDEWHRIRRGEARVVVGPRSAVFAPVERLGLIVVDEEHEPSYKQDETPRYHARDVAVMRGHFEGCAVVLGSATPSLESWRNVSLGKYAVARLPQRADNCAMPLVHVIDMRRELARSGHVQVFSQFLIDAVQGRLERGEQVMLFLNRRGYATALVCPACGHVATCEACGVAFTYHRVDDCLRCHTCGAWQRPPASCPACGDPAFRQTGFGTQRVESIVARCFPKARVARMDTDSTSRRLSHDDILGAFRTGRTDILVGTQMIAKGLHFPNVTLVGIVLADSSLHLPDFRAGERTFQLLAQVAGRAGRGTTPGEVVVQTYTPDHPAVAAARTEDFEAFAAGELPLRERLRFPPYAHLVCLTLRGADEARTAFTAATLARALRAAAARGVDVSEACPAPLAKARGEFRYQVILRAAATRAMTEPLRGVLRANQPPREVSLAVDVDAVSLL